MSIALLNQLGIVFVLLASGLIICIPVAVIGAWIVAAGIAKQEGRERLALLLAIFPVAGWVFLLRRKRYRQAAWIGKFLFLGLAMALAMVVLFYCSPLMFASR